MTTTETGVARVGQVWRDRDPRAGGGRRITILALTSKPLRGHPDTRVPAVRVKDNSGVITTIRADRLPTAYCLVYDVPPGSDEAALALAARRLGRLAGWIQPPDWTTPDVDLAYAWALRSCSTDPARMQELTQVMAMLRRDTES